MRRWRAAGVLLVAVLGASGTAAAGVPLAELWYGLQTRLAAGETGDLAQRVEELRRAGSVTGADRLVTYARALAMWARTHPGEEGDAALVAALELDPRCAEARLLRARRSWEGGAYGSASAELVRGLLDLAADPWTRPDLLGSFLVWVVLAGAGAALAWVGLQASRYLPELLHDGMELGRTMFSPVNAWVFAVAVTLLPVLAGLGPVWLVSYLLGLTLVYMPRREIAAAAVAWVVLVATVPVLEVWQQRGLADPSPASRARSAIEDGIVDTMLLDELLGVEPELRGVPPYHMLAGELLHLHGDLLAAQEQFQLVSVYAPDWPAPHLWLGNLALEEGDVKLAIQQYRLAVQKAPEWAVAYYNLSVALDQAHLFQEADEARARATALGIDAEEVVYRSITGVRIAYPRDAAAVFADLLAALGPEQRVLLRLEAPPVSLREGFTSPFTLAFLAPGLLGVALTALRRQLRWRARSCLRCGKVFCERCKTSTESQAYCTQCISVFLKRDSVALEQQAAKLQQIRRFERRRMLVRRAVGTLLPGAGSTVSGAPWRGLALLFGAALGVVGLAVWLPWFAPALAGEAPGAPLRLALGAWTAVVWVLGVRFAWREA